jgi:hypothetical protein
MISAVRVGCWARFGDQRDRSAHPQPVPPARQDGRGTGSRAKFRRRYGDAFKTAAAPEVSALAASEDGKLGILVWHYHDDDVPGPDASVELRLTGLALPSGALSLRMIHYRVDADHSNAHMVWQKMSAPQSPTLAQRNQLEQAAQIALLGAPGEVTVQNGCAALRASLCCAKPCPFWCWKMRPRTPSRPEPPHHT